MQNRRQILSQIACGMAAAALPFGAKADTLESAKILAGFAPGGTIDTEARRVANRLTGAYAKAVFVDNRPGAGGQIAISALKAAAPDGSTLLATPMSMLGIYPHTYKKLPYDPIADLTPVSMGVYVDMGLAVGPLVPASVTNIPEFLAWCKANPDQANFGSPAPGSVPHFVGVLIGRAGNVDLRHVGFRGTQPAIMDLVGGQIAAVSAPVGEFLPHLPGGKLRILATSGAARSKFVPQVPTLAEQGYKSLVYGEWHGFFLPGKASAAVVKNANAAIRQALAQWRQFRPRPCDAGLGIQLGAGVCLVDPEGRQQHLFLGPAGGSMKLQIGTQLVQVISTDAPLGRALLGKGEGDEVVIGAGAVRQQWEVLGVV